MSEGNGHNAPPNIDPANLWQTKLLMIVRKIEEELGGEGVANITVFIASPERPREYNFATTAAPAKLQITLQQHLAEMKA